MSKTRRFTQFIFSTIVILSMSLSVSQPQPASAQGGDGIQRQVNAETGRVSFIGPESGRVLSASRALGSLARPADPALALAKRFAPEFGLKNPERELTEMKANHPGDGRMSVRYQQNYEGIPVMGGELIVNTNENGDLYSMNGEVSPDLSLSTQPTIDSAQAKESALLAAAKWYQKSPEDFLVSEPELWIFDESLLRSSTRPVELVWRMEVTSVDNSLPLRELVLIDAQRGNISLHFNQVDTAWHSLDSSLSIEQARASNKSDANTAGFENSTLLTFSPLVKTYTANNTSSLPGTLLCNQSQPNCTSGGNLHADAAHKYAIGTFNLYDTKHNRNSINANGMAIISTVNYCGDGGFECPYANAFWSGTQMVYGDAYGFALADDVVGHELTHGVTQHESNLFYYYQSGAINESFSDVWGEYYDQTNGQGNDTSGVKWQMGEDVSGYGALRNMRDPTVFGNPDKMTSPYYYIDEGDNGGVHYNSGINNKAVFLMVDGGTFNGKTVSALGWDKTAAIYYEAQTNLLISGSDYSDLYYALQQACSNLIGQKGITAGNCAEIKDAIDAVEMNTQPTSDFNSDAPLCNTVGHVPFVTFADNIEAGASNWAFTSIPNELHWQVDSSYYGQYAQSGFHSLYADDFPDEPTDASARLVSFTVPSNAYLHFAHAYGFENFFSDYYDGGVLEYSTNGGSTWLDAGSLMEVNGYNGTIFTGSFNPLEGRSAFVGTSHGYISTRLNLASLAGQTVAFRWRMGLDAAIYAWGWWMDNIKVYRCGAPNLDVRIGGTLIDRNYIPAGSSLRESYPGVDSGPVKVASTNGIDILAAMRVIWKEPGYRSSYSEMMGLPKEQLSTEYWFPWYNNATSSMDQSFRIANMEATSATIEVLVGTTLLDSFTLGVDQSVRKSYAGIDNGPIRIRSTNSKKIIAAMRVIWKEPGYRSSYSELMGLPKEQLSTEYWFPWYNSTATASMDQGFRIANVGSTSAVIKVMVSNTELDSFTLDPGESTRKSYAGVDFGPIRIYSTDGTTRIIAAMRVIWKEPGYRSSYSELMGLPKEQLSTKYWFPWYNNLATSSMDQAFRIAHVNATGPNMIKVMVGSTELDSIVLGTLATSTRVSYSIDNGPISIICTTCTGSEKIIAAMRVIWKESGKRTSYSELIGLPTEQLSTEYWFPWYNNAVPTSMDQAFRISVP
jgi:bacillolysin